MVGIILLAAGASQRMGKPKQTLVYRGQSLLQHAVQTANTVNPDYVVVVLGAAADTILEEIKDAEVQVIINTEWKEGMSNSIRCGLLSLLRVHPVVEAVIIMVCDQPHVSPELLQELIHQRMLTGKKIIACEYNATAGVPALFDKQYFPDLLALEGQSGARHLIKKYAADVATVPFPEGRIDIDTKEDYEALQKN